VTSIDTARQELRARLSALEVESGQVRAALDALNALGGNGGRPMKTAAKRRPRGSVTEAIRAAAVVPVKAGEIAAKTGIDRHLLRVMLAKMASLGVLIRVGVGLYQRADCLETAAQSKPAPVDVHEFASAQ
jgi:hypothetical protein